MKFQQSIVNFSETQQKKDGVNGKWNQKDGESSHRYKPYLVKLAPESPLLKSSDVFHDDNSYDSFHNYETGETFCANHRRPPSCPDPHPCRVEISDRLRRRKSAFMACFSVRRKKSCSDMQTGDKFVNTLVFLFIMLIKLE